MDTKRPRVLVLIAHYLPGFRSGGPIRSIANIVEKFGDEFSFRILTRDRDYLSHEPFEGIPSSRWVPRGAAHIWYLPGRLLLPLRICSVLRNEEYDLVFLNSIFERRFSMLPLVLRRLGLLRDCPWVVASRGELSEGALSIRGWRKRLYLWLAKSIGLFSGVVFQASHELESNEIKQIFGANAMTRVVPDALLPGPYSLKLPASGEQGMREDGVTPLRVVFLSRIAPKKNLRFAIEAMRSCQEQIVFHVYGPIDDRGYWAECLATAALLGPNVTFEYRGEVRHESVLALFADYDVFFFPTLGENYGHVIVEALAAGCPALLSDATPWQDLDAAGAGWVRRLGDVGAFVAVLDIHARKSRSERWRCALRARAYASNYFEKLVTSGATFEVFSELLGVPRGAADLSQGEDATIA